MKIQPVILCGGSGTRLWPSSRTSYPKQFIRLGSGRTLFRETLCRGNQALVNEKTEELLSEIRGQA